MTDLSRARSEHKKKRDEVAFRRSVSQAQSQDDEAVCSSAAPRRIFRQRLFELAVAIEELLDCSEWSLVQFLAAFEQAKMYAKFAMQ